MAQDHYFSSEPQIAEKQTQISFSVSGQPLTLTASSGTFSSQKLDSGTAVLLGLNEQFPQSGEILDLGCGWGPIGISIAKLRPETKVTGVDVNRRSVELANQNAAAAGVPNFTAVHAQDLDPKLTFDEIWSNPPIRIGKQELHRLLGEYLAKLIPGGRAYLVVQKQLGADSLQRWLADSYPNRIVERVANSKGYRVILINPANAQ